MRPSAVRPTITVVFMLAGTLATWAAEQPRGELNQPLPRWTLATGDTRLVIGVGRQGRSQSGAAAPIENLRGTTANSLISDAGTDQRPYIQELSSPAGWNWTAAPSPFPLLGRADVAGTPRTLDWVYQQGTEDKTDGTKVTLTFANADPALELIFDIAGRGFAVFKATVGLDDLGAKGSVQFQVLVDGQKKAESPIMRPKKSHELVVDLAGAKEITLRVLNGGDGYGWDHAVWGLVRFLKAETEDPLVRK